LARARATQLTEVLEKQLLAGLFVHRYRDVCDDIRCVAIEGLAQWVIALGFVPFEFLFIYFNSLTRFSGL
jgi:hypothetical protein